MVELAQLITIVSSFIFLESLSVPFFYISLLKPLALSVCLLSPVVGMIVMPTAIISALALLTLANMGVSIGITHLVGDYPFWLQYSLKKDKMLKIQDKYEDTISSSKDVASILSTATDERREKMMSRLSFKELFIARKILGPKKFHSINDKLTTPANQLWKMIELSDPTNLEHRRQLTVYMDQDPMIAQAVYTYNPSFQPLYEDNSFSSFVIQQQQYHVNNQLLMDHFDYFKNFNQTHLNEPFEIDQSHANQFLKMIDLMKNPSKYYLNLDQFLN